MVTLSIYIYKHIHARAHVHTYISFNLFRKKRKGGTLRSACLALTITMDKSSSVGVLRSLKCQLRGSGHAPTT